MRELEACSDPQREGSGHPLRLGRDVTSERKLLRRVMDGGSAWLGSRRAELDQTGCSLRRLASAGPNLRSRGPSGAVSWRSYHQIGTVKDVGSERVSVGMRRGRAEAMIEKSALVALKDGDATGSLLLVKEEGDSHWLLPGGKLKEDETVENALVREISEELSTDVVGIEQIGTVDGETVDGAQLRIHLFLGRLKTSPIANGEITQLRWIERSEIPAVQRDLTPITVKEVFPFLAAHRLW